MTRTAVRAICFAIAAAVVAADRLTKYWVKRDIPLYGGFQVIPHVFRITHVENTGAAFSLFANSSSHWTMNFLIAFSLLAMVVVGSLIWRSASHRITLSAVALALIFGGALGNVWDRVVNRRVVDFLLFYVKQYEWPAFNLADSAIVVGASCIALEILLTKSDKSDPEAEASS